MSHCLICQALIEPFMSFGRMPIANGFLRQEDLAQEFFFDLQIGFCHQCTMVQLTELVDPSKLFHENYAYFSSISTRMARHFQAFAEWVQQDYLADKTGLVVEIGSNDGIMLQHFAHAGIRHLGVEPSANVAEAARRKGVQTVSCFFSQEAAETLREQYGPADVVLGANVICHLPDLHSVLRGLDVLLSPHGVFIFEEPYLGQIVEKTSYDQIYDEHVFYFSLNSLSYLFAQYNFEIVDVAPQPVHGGSMRYVVARRGMRSISPAVHAQRAHEQELGLTRAETFDRLRDNIDASRMQLVTLLQRLRSMGKRIVGYGATSKSTTVTNFCGIGPDLIEFISDTTPGKQHTYSPGVHIPVLPYERFTEKYPDYALLFAWNHADEIMAKEQEFQRQGGRFIRYVPTVAVLPEAAGG